ncbi:MAG TPA: M3 family metallopeptidase [Armatimonadota bacterium]|jgi:peptidyl-dipeptidase A
MTQDTSFRAFLEGHLNTVMPLAKELNLVSWDAACTGSPEAEASLEKLDIAYQTIYADPANYKRLKAMAAGPWDDPLLQRQHKLLLDEFTGLQIAPEDIVALAALDTKLRTLFNTHRGSVGGKPVSDNEIKQILHESDDSALRKEAWETSKSIGALASETILEAVCLRNKVARKLGYPDFYTMRISLDDLDVESVYTVLGELEAASDGPWTRAKATLDQRLSKRFGVPVDGLCPWHYQDPFFQEAPASDADLDSFFQGKDLEEAAKAFFGEMGLPVDAILARSDLYERPGKNQHAFCTDIDKRGDIRTLCNLTSNAQSMGTLCHELGHATYDDGLNKDLPWVLSGAAHGLTTEGIAILMEYFPRKGKWLETYVGADPAAAARAEALSARSQAVADLVTVRWFLVMCHFERGLYANPDQDVNALWWNLVERFQRVKCPDGRNAPDWAAKIHTALWPVYYHLYPLGGVAASMWRAVMRKSYPMAAEGLADPAFGAYLREEVFAPGASVNWQALIECSTGEPLTTRHWAEEWDSAV